MKRDGSAPTATPAPASSVATRRAPPGRAAPALRVVAALGLGSLAFGAWAACSDAEILANLRALGEGCLLDSDCASPLVCVFQRCHHECETDPDCKQIGVSTLCSVGDRPTNVCLLDDEATCTVIDDGHGAAVYVSADCPGDLVCARDGQCRDACQSDGECLPGAKCLKGTCANV